MTEVTGLPSWYDKTCPCAYCCTVRASGKAVWTEDDFSIYSWGRADMTTMREGSPSNFKPAHDKHALMTVTTTSEPVGEPIVKNGQMLYLVTVYQNLKGEEPAKVLEQSELKIGTSAQQVIGQTITRMGQDYDPETMFIQVEPKVWPTT